MTTDADACAELARTAGEVLPRMRNSFGNDVEGKERGKASDAGAQFAIAAMLAERFPHGAVLTEEATDTDTRLAAERVWFIDPLALPGRRGAPHPTLTGVSHF